MSKFLERPQWNDNGTYREAAKITLNGTVNQSPSFYAPISLSYNNGEFLTVNDSFSGLEWKEPYLKGYANSSSATGNTITAPLSSTKVGSYFNFLVIVGAISLKGNKSSSANERAHFFGIASQNDTYKYYFSLQYSKYSRDFTNISTSVSLTYNGSSVTFSYSFQGNYNTETYMPTAISVNTYKFG